MSVVIGFCREEEMALPFCEECGATFMRDSAKFCGECRTPRGFRTNGVQPTSPMEVPMPELPERTQEDDVEEHIDNEARNNLRGPPGRQGVVRVPQQKPPSYNMVFDPPSLQNRSKNKLYGRRCLKQEYPIQHKCYVDNYKKTHAWIEEGQSSGLLPDGTFTLEDPSVRVVLKSIINEKKDDLMDIKFGRNKKYAWREGDIYKKMKKNLKYRRWKKRKAEKENHIVSSASDTVEGGEEQNSLVSSQPIDTLESREFVGVGNEEEEIDEESFIMRELDVENVNEMYAVLSNFMIGENELARREKRRVPFPQNSRLLSDEEKLTLVARFLHSQG